MTEQELIDKYLPASGEGETRATQIVTAVCKIRYKWYNDGDVYDNTYMLTGWCNDLSSYANWLANHYESARKVLEKIKDAYDGETYQNIIKELFAVMIDEKLLQNENLLSKDGSIYDEEGQFKFVELDEEWEDEEEW